MNNYIIAILLFIVSCSTQDMSIEKECAEGAVYSLYICEYRGEKCAILCPKGGGTPLFVSNFEEIKDRIDTDAEEQKVRVAYQASDVYTQDIKCACEEIEDCQNSATQPVTVECITGKARQ